MKPHLPSTLLGTACTLALLCLLAPLRADTDMPLVNPGFENGLTGWSLWQDDGMSQVVSEAAHTDKLGLRVTNAGTTHDGLNMENRRFPAIPGKVYDLKFWVRTISGAGGGAYIKFWDANGQDLPPENHAGSDAAAWTQIELKATAPPTATQVGIWVHTGNKLPTTVDFDDFTLTQLD